MALEPDAATTQAAIDTQITIYLARFGGKLRSAEGWLRLDQSPLACRATLQEQFVDGSWYVAVLRVEVALDAARTNVIRDTIQAKGMTAEEALEGAVVLAVESTVLTAWAAVGSRTAMPWIRHTSMATAGGERVTSWALVQGDVFVGVGQDEFEALLQQRRPIELVQQALVNAVHDGRLRADGRPNWASLHLTRQHDGSFQGTGMLNNDPWPEALDELADNISWPEEAGALTCRQLTILRAVDEEPVRSSPMQNWGARLRRLFGRS